MSLILSGVVQKGISVLEKLEGLSEKATLVLAFAYWFAGKSKAALDIIA